jgi:predicted CoA-binding protein
MTEAGQILDNADSVVVVDWPSRDVPDSLTRAGLAVVVKGGPGLDDYAAYELSHGEVVVRGVGRRPEHADIVYSHRPIGELPGIVALAQQLGAKTVWRQSGLAGNGAKDPKGCWVPEDESREARKIVESAGLAYVDDTYIADAVRGLGRRP